MECTIWKHWGCIPETNPSEVNRIFNNSLEDAGFGIVGFIEQPLRDRGYGSYATQRILKESHCTTRTFPRYGITYYEISSCNYQKYDVFVRRLNPMSISTTKLRLWSHQMIIGQTKPERLKQAIEKLIQRAKFNVVDFVEHYFPEDGFTGGWVLEYGNINIHTFPEDEKSDLELTLFHRHGFTMITTMLDDELYI